MYTHVHNTCIRRNVGVKRIRWNLGVKIEGVQEMARGTTQVSQAYIAILSLESQFGEIVEESVKSTDS